MSDKIAVEKLDALIAFFDAFNHWLDERSSTLPER